MPSSQLTSMEFGKEFGYHWKDWRNVTVGQVEQVKAGKTSKPGMKRNILVLLVVLDLPVLLS
jgi:hypothetical protein